jgi:hypothetical protein
MLKSDNRTSCFEFKHIDVPVVLDFDRVLQYNIGHYFHMNILNSNMEINRL